MNSLFDWLRRHPNWAVVAVLLIVLLYALHEPFPVDDAYISYRYAHNLVAGDGMVWNIGERVEGYSNFLWTLLIAVGLKIGMEPEVWAMILGIPLLLIAVFLTYRLALVLLESRGLALAAALLFGLNHSAAGFATSGLETPLSALEFVGAAYLFVIAAGRGWTWRRTVAFAILLNVALLTRPDAILLAAAGVAGWAVTRKPQRINGWLPIVAPFLIILLPYLIWKQVYFGTIVPNSYNAKVHGLTGLPWGLYYLYMYLIYYLALPYAVLLIWLSRRIWHTNRTMGFVILFVGLWAAYLTFIGGDFMEFRFIVPILPLFMIASLYCIKTLTDDNLARWALIAGLLVGTASNLFEYGMKFYSYGVERLDGLKSHLYAPDEDWVDAGKKLGELFGGTDVILSCGASGAIPYYSGLHTIDFMGLTDKEIPKISEPFSNMPGHRIIAPLDYLVRRNVNIIVEPINFTLSRLEFERWWRSATWMDAYAYFMDLDKPAGGRLIDEVNLLAIPYGSNGYTLIVWYLTPSPVVDRVVQQFNLRRIKLTRG